MDGSRPQQTYELLVGAEGPERADALLRVSARAYAERRKPSAQDVAQFEALAATLFEAASVEGRREAAQLLSRAALLSPALQQLVVGAIGTGLVDFLLAARSLDEGALLGALATGDVEAATAMARRGDLTSRVLGKLLQMNSRKVYRALASNTAIAPRGLVLSALARSAGMDHQVAWSLAARDDFDAALLAPAFFDLREADRLKVIRAFAERATPPAPIRKTLEQVSVVTSELTAALMTLFADNRRPEVTLLLHQITGLDDIRAAEIAHDVSGAALFVVLRAFGCDAYDGLKVLIHATSHDVDRSPTLSAFSQLFASVSPDAMAFLMSAWRGEVNLLDLGRPEYRAAPNRRRGEAIAATTRRTGEARQRKRA